MPDQSPEALHQHLLERAPRILRFDPQDYFPEWQSAVRRSLRQLLGLMPAKVPLENQILSDDTFPAPDSHRAITFTFTAEPAATITATLRIPAQAPSPTPLIIYPTGRPTAPLDSSTALLTFDQRGVGLRRSSHDLNHASLTALLLGRTLMGERLFDISRSIDAVAELFPQIDLTRIAIIGPEIAYYAAALEPRISAVAAHNIAFYRDALAARPYPSEMYIPNILHYFEMSDLAGLIFPRPLIVAAASHDPLFPLPLVQSCFTEISQIYRAQDAPEKCQLVEAKSPLSAELLWSHLRPLLN